MEDRANEEYPMTSDVYIEKKDDINFMALGVNTEREYVVYLYYAQLCDGIPVTWVFMDGSSFDPRTGEEGEIDAKWVWDNIWKKKI
jgi:hypothetical protein